jgi:hypothetical protein
MLILPREDNYMCQNQKELVGIVSNVQYVYIYIYTYVFIYTYMLLSIGIYTIDIYLFIYIYTTDIYIYIHLLVNSLALGLFGMSCCSIENSSVNN